MRRMPIVPGLVLALLVPAAVLATTFPIGPNFRVNALTDGDQRLPGVGAGGGRFVVVWNSGYGAFKAQRVHSSGTRIGSEVTVANYFVLSPLVAVGPGGDFAVAWDLSSGPIRARVFDDMGTPQGAEFSVSTAPGSYATEPAIAADGLGNYIVSWTDVLDGDFSGVFARRYDSTGAAIGGQFQVNTYTTSAQGKSSVWADGAGNFAITWIGVGTGGSLGLHARRYDSTGTPLADQFQVNTATTQFGGQPAVARTPAGDFVVAWADHFYATGISAQRFDAAGTALGPPTTVTNTLPVTAPKLATDASGDFVVTWKSSQSYFYETIHTARFESDGTPQGGELRVNTYAGSKRDAPLVAGEAAGSFLVVWRDRIGNDIVAQRFSGACGNGTIDAGEACDDGNNASGDGCEANCLVQTCFSCAGAPSSCSPIATCVTGDGCCAPGCTPANDHDCTTLAFGAQLLVQNRQILFKAKDPGIDSTPGTGIDPVADGAFLHVYNTNGLGKSACYALRTEGSALWAIRGSTTTGPVFAYTDRDKVVGPCKLARVRDGQLLRVKCVNFPFTNVYTLGDPTQGSMGVRFTSGPSAICSEFGGIRRDNDVIFLAVSAPAPVSCPVPPVPCPAMIPAGP